MEYIKFENLLGEHISVAKSYTSSDFKVNKFEFNKSNIKFYSNKDYVHKDFYGMFYNHLTIHTNEKDTIQKITIHFRTVINREFYDSFIKQYGLPNNIQVIGYKQVISEDIYGDENFYQKLRKSIFDLREGKFEEKPLYIIWKKRDYQVKAFLRHKQNISEITFSIPSEEF